MKTSFKAVRAALVAVFVFMVGFAAEAQRVRLLQLERYLGQPIPNRAGYVGITDTLGDQYYHKLDSIIGYIADSISQGLDTDEQYFDTAMIVNDTLILSIIRDGLPAHRISLTAYTSDDQTLSYDHASNTLSISGGNSVTNFEQAWLRQADLLHPILHTESILRRGNTTLGWNGFTDSSSFDEAQLRVRNESRIDWLTYTTSKPTSFGQRYFEVSELSNLLYLADKRYTVTMAPTSAYLYGYFNGEFGNPVPLTASSTTEINIDFTEGLEKLSATGVTYPQGYIYINFYYVYNDYDSIKVEAITTGGTYNISSTVKNISTTPHLGYKVLRYAVPDYNYLTDIKLTFYTNAGNCWPTEIQYTQTRYNGELEEPFLNKHVDNTLHTKLTFRDKVGDRQRDNGTWGQILMSKVDSVEWADFSDIPGIYTYITNISDSVDTDTDTDEQTIDSFAITDDTLRISLSNDPDIFNVSLKQYIDTAFAMYDTDSQSVSQFYLDGTDSLHIQLTRGNHQSVYLGSLVPAAGSDKQRFDTLWIVNDTAWYSLQRDSVNAIPLNLKPYLDNTDDQKIDVFTFVGTTLSVSNEDDGEASKTVDLSSLVDNWLLNGLDDAFGSTDIGDAETVTFDGTGGITAKLSFDGSNTMVIDGTGLQWILQAQSGTSQVIGDADSEIVEIVGAGNASTSIFGNTVTITVPADVDNYVDALTFSNSTFILTAGRTGALPDLTDTIMDHDWYKVGTALPPNNTEDARRNGLTGIGMDPIWLLDVAEDARINGHQIGTGPTIGLHTNIRFGKDALEVNTGSYNLAIGGSALKGNTSGTNNVAIGYESLKSNNSSYNIGIGVESLYSNNTGALMIGIGYQALRQNTVGVDNTSIGHGSQQSGTDASYNTSLGHETMYQNIHGIENTAIGDFALRDDTLAQKNIAIGRFSLNLTDNANSNIGIGYYALHYSLGANYNIAIGDSAMHNSVPTAGLIDNIAIGKKVLNGVVANSNDNIVIGKSGAALSGDNNSIYGNDNTVTGAVDNNVIIGDGQTATTAGNIIITNGAGVLGFKMLTSGFVGIGEATPTQKLHVPGNVRVTGAYYDSNNEPGTAGQVLSSLAGIGTDWVDATSGGTMSYFFINGNDDAFGNTQVDQGEVITIDGTGGITASLAASGSLSYVIDGSGITGTTNLSITNSANPGLNSSNGSDVIFQDGTGINAVYVNDFTIRFDATDASITNEIQSLSFGYGAGQSAITISGDPSTLYMYSGTGITFSGQTGTTLTINAADVAANNEGFNGVGTGGPTSSTITTNTTGGNAITLNVAGTLSISEVANANGGSITITGTGGAGTVTSVGLTGTTGIGVTGSPITTSGTFALSLNNDLAALEGLGSTGIAYRTGAATWTTYAFGSMPTGLSTGYLLYVGADGTPDIDTDLGYNAGTNTLTASFITVANQITAGTVSPNSLNVSGSSVLNTVAASGSFSASNSVITFSSIPTYASDAAAGSGGLGSGRVYRTSSGELRIKL